MDASLKAGIYGERKAIGQSGEVSFSAAKRAERNDPKASEGAKGE